MRLLAFETAGDGCSAGVFAAGTAVAMRYRPGATGHAEALVPMLAAVLAEAGVELDALDALAVTTGPGSFTGIRTGLAAARGLALATGLPVWPVTTFAALATPLASRRPGAAPIAVALDARRGQVFLQLFSATGTPSGAPAVLPPEAAATRLTRPHRLVGSGVPLVLRHLAAAAGATVLPAVLDATAVARAAEAAAAAGGLPVPGLALEPLYLRDADARPSAGRPLLGA